MRVRRPRHDEQSRGVAIEPMDDAGPVGLAARCATGNQPVDERSAGVAGRRMHHDARRLVDDEQVLVLVRDPERHVLRLHLDLRPLPNHDGQLLAAGDTVALRARQPVDSDRSVGEQPLRLLARANRGQIG